MTLLKSLKTQLPQSALTAINTKIAEGASFIRNEFNNATASFKKLTAGRKTIKEAAGDVNRKLKDLRSEGEKRLAALDEFSRLQAEDALTFNALSSNEANNAVLDSVDADVQASFIEQRKRLEADLETAGTDGRSDYKVRLYGVSKSQLSDGEFAEVIFDVMPEITEGRNVAYEEVQPAQFPGAFQKYRGTGATDWTINASLISRTSAEAYKNLLVINQLRAWTMPFFGENTAKSFQGRLGAPPPVLTFSGWKERMVGPVPVVITSLNWTFPQDVDYIPAVPDEAASDFDPIPFPVFIRVTVQLKESFSIDEFNRFDLEAFSNGLMVGAFGFNQLPASRSELQTIESTGTGEAQAVEESGAAGAPTTQAAAATDESGAAQPATPATTEKAGTPVDSVTTASAPAVPEQPPAAAAANNDAPVTNFPPPPTLKTSGAQPPPLLGNTKDEQLADAKQRIATNEKYAAEWQAKKADAERRLAEAEGSLFGANAARQARAELGVINTFLSDVEAQKAYRQQQIAIIEAAKGGN